MLDQLGGFQIPYTIARVVEDLNTTNKYFYIIIFIKIYIINAVLACARAQKRGKNRVQGCKLS